MVAMVLAMPEVVPAADYKPEYELSLVLGKPFPWGVGGERWADDMRAELDYWREVRNGFGLEDSQSGGGDRTF